MSFEGLVPFNTHVSLRKNGSRYLVHGQLVAGEVKDEEGKEAICLDYVELLLSPKKN